MVSAKIQALIKEAKQDGFLKLAEEQRTVQSIQEMVDSTDGASTMSELLEQEEQWGCVLQNDPFTRD